MVLWLKHKENTLAVARIALLSVVFTVGRENS